MLQLTLKSAGEQMSGFLRVIRNLEDWRETRCGATVASPLRLRRPRLAAVLASPFPLERRLTVASSLPAAERILDRDLETELDEPRLASPSVLNPSCALLEPLIKTVNQ